MNNNHMSSHIVRKIIYKLFMSADLAEINCPEFLSNCTTCKVVGYERRLNTACLQIKCRQCQSSWIVCVQCKIKLANNKNLVSHLKTNRHLKKVPLLNQRLIGMASPNEPNTDSDEPMLQLDVISPSRIISKNVVIKEETTEIQDWMLSTLGPRSTDQVSKESLQNVFCKDSTSPPFYHYESSNPGFGAHFLVASAFDITDPKSVSMEEVKFSLNMAGLLSRLTENERVQLADIMLAAVNANNKEKSIFQTIRLPTSTDDFKSIFVSGRKSILKNIPRPVVHTTADNTHAYVNLIDMIANMMAANIPIDRFDNSTASPAMTAKLVTKQNGPGVCSTRAAHILLIELTEGTATDEYTGYLYCKEWSDDFDPSHSKDNRNQVWMKTYTICPPMESSQPDTGRHTAVISLGSKCDDHDEVESLITDQLRQLGSGEGTTFYHGGLNNNKGWCFIDLCRSS
jgi:hypothetical protein